MTSKVADNVLVSVQCLVYNHAPYLRQCFDGFVMQQTTFLYEVIVHDDASTDGSDDIIREYARKYPHLFKVEIQPENIYSKGISPLKEYVMPKCQGKYIAYCEGDDYWTDPLKLQKQVDFLESHPTYEICAHETMVLFENRKEILYSEFANNLLISITKQDYVFDEILTGNIFHISSMMYRQFDFQMPQWARKTLAGDMVLFRLLGEHGKLYVLRDCMSVYRDHSDSVTNTRVEFQSKLQSYLKISIPILRLLNRYWGRKYQGKIYPIIAKYYSECAWVYLHRSTRDFRRSMQMFRMAMLYDRGASLKYLFKRFINRCFVR